MQRSRHFGLSAFLIGPLVLLVLAAAVMGLWLAGRAAYENIQLAHGTDQILGVVGMARGMSAETRASADKVLGSLRDQLQQAPGTEMPGTGADRAAIMIINPWQRPMAIHVLPPPSLPGSAAAASPPPPLPLVSPKAPPAVKALPATLRLDSQVSVTVCRRLILFFDKDMRSLGLTRIEVRDLQAPSGRLVYDAAAAAARLGQAAIIAGCGQGSLVNLTLNFSL